MHEVLVNCLVKLAQEKSVVRLTDHLDMAIAVDWDVKRKTKQTKFGALYRALGLKNIFSIVAKLYFQQKKKSCIVIFTYHN